MKKKKDNKYVVYLHTLKSDGRKYVGITYQKPEKRWSKGYGYYGQKHFYNAIKKYGWDSFKHEIVFENLTEEQACNKEIALIKLFQTQNPKYGFNHTNGGEHATLNVEIREKLSKANIVWDIDKDILYDLYLVQNKTIKECASILNVPRTAIINNLNKYKFKKTKDQVKENIKKGANTKRKNISYEKLKHLYIDLDWTQKQCAEYFNCNKDLISCRLKEYNIIKRLPITEEDLRYQRISLKKSLNECANYFNCTKNAIIYNLKKYNIIGGGA